MSVFISPMTHQAFKYNEEREEVPKSQADVYSWDKPVPLHRACL